MSSVQRITFVPSISEVCSNEEAIADPTFRHDMLKHVLCGTENAFMIQQTEVCISIGSVSDTWMLAPDTCRNHIQNSGGLVLWFWNASRWNRAPRIGMYSVQH